MWPRKRRVARHSGDTFRRFILTQAVLRIDLCGSGVPTHFSLPQGGSTEPARRVLAFAEEATMKSRTLAITLFAALAIPVRLASAQVTCTVTDLGMLGGTFAQPDTLNNRGEAVGEPLCPVTQPFIDP